MITSPAVLNEFSAFNRLSIALNRLAIGSRSNSDGKRGYSMVGESVRAVVLDALHQNSKTAKVMVKT